ncbi:MAG: nodulation protein NfeD [Caldithrix sp.]|nr:nodulation protein NfeD [Caldithrix sp.]
MRLKFSILLIIILGVSMAHAATVHRIVIDGVINPAAKDYIEKSILRAEEENAELLIIQMDTPGGLMSSMHEISKAIQNAYVPVAVYVAPGGARAGSAGVYITYASHIAVMAPATNIGSAHPVFGSGIGGQQPDSASSETMMEKVINDAVAKIKAVAEKRGRNAEWAEKAVRESANITAEEALALNVIEYIAPDTDSLLTAVDGIVIKLDVGVEKELRTKNVRIVTYEMDWRQRLLDVISNPNIAYFLMILGFYGLLFELYSPGAILPGVVGGISLILGLYALQTLPVNYAGLLLIIFAIILFLLEIKVQSFGLLSIGGVIALVLGSVMLIDSPFPFLQISWQVILGVVIITILFFGFAIGMAIRTFRSKVNTGREGMVGEIGEVYKTINPEGRIKIHGELWKALSDEKITKGKRVKIVEYDGKNLLVKVKKI